jgi:2'-5' RNA ligase
MDDSGCGRHLLRLLPPPEQATAPLGHSDSGRPPIAHPFDYSSLQINLPPAIGQAIIDFAATIPDADVAEAGRTMQPHLTIRRRLLTKYPSELIAMLADQQAFSVTFRRTHIFVTPDHDIVHLDVVSEHLQELRDAVSTLQHSDPHVTYHPHVTIAFVKPGCGAKYGGDEFLAGLAMSVRALTFSGADETVVDIPLLRSGD